MGIDKHYILTLERSQRRQDAVRGGARAMQTPREKIKFIKGHDNKDFNDNMEAVAIAAERDGFPFVYQFAEGLKDDSVGQSASCAAQAWNFARILRQIALGDEVCLVTWDDRLITLPFPFIDKIVTELQSRDEEFYAFQLRVRFGDAHYKWPNNAQMLTNYPDLFVDAEKHKEYLDMLVRDSDIANKMMNSQWASEFSHFRRDHFVGNKMGMPIDEYVDSHLIKNLIALDESIVFSPKGAAWMLYHANNMEELPDRIPKDDRIYQSTEKYAQLIYEYHRKRRDDLTLEDCMPSWYWKVYRRNSFDSWISTDFVPHVEEAIADGKGIYCPKRIGYRYISDWLMMGSDVQWSNPENEFLETYRTQSEEIEFLDIL